jgi:hypothetical protein
MQVKSEKEGTRQVEQLETVTTPSGLKVLQLDIGKCQKRNGVDTKCLECEKIFGDSWHNVVPYHLRTLIAFL